MCYNYSNGEKKEERPKAAYIIKKSNSRVRVDTSVGAVTSRAGNHSVVDGSGIANYGTVIKEREKDRAKRKPLHETGYFLDKEDLLTDEEDEEILQQVKESLAREKESYVFQHPMEREPQTIKPPDRDEGAREGAEQRKEAILRWQKRNHRPPVNRTPIKGEKS